MLLATASIGRKLLLSFIALAMLVMLSALIGVLGFSLVAKTERNVVDTAIPAMIEARQVSELSSRIIASVQTLSNAKNEPERQAAGKVVFTQLDKLLSHIKRLGSSGSFDPDLLLRLEVNVQQVIDNLAQLGLSVETRLKLASEIAAQTAQMRLLSNELEQLTRTQVLNTSTTAVANITHLYALLSAGDREAIIQALDAFVEEDLDLSERLHELHLLAFRMLNQIEEARTLSNAQRIDEVSREFAANLKLMQRRVSAVEDPTRLAQMAQLLQQLAKRKHVFSLLSQQEENNQQSQALMLATLDLFTQLNSTVNHLVDASNQATSEAAQALTQTLDFARTLLTLISLLGFAIVVLIVWRVVYVSVVKRLTEYSSALLAVAQGDLNVSLQVQGQDELAQMGRAIIKARDTAQALKIVAQGEAQAKRELQEHKEHLEKVVAERTSQLQLTNEKLNSEVLNHAKARIEAEQANRAKSAFLATMSHEIRTPMNGVLGTTRLLIDSGLNATQRYYADIIDRSGHNLLTILNDVLDYSKIEAGHLQIRLAPFDLPQLVQDSFQLMKSRAKEKQLAFDYHLESDLGRHWIGDATRLGQVLNNLVGNAIKFTTDGEVDIYVCRDPEDETRVLFEVSDSGVGIAPAELAKLFDAFTQVGEGLTHAGGTGLGLAISKRLVEAMGGEIGVESQLNVGSRFWFSVPLESTEVPEESETRAQPCASNVSATILLVEDNPVNRLVAEGFLHSLGHQVLVAENGTEAEELARQHAFDLALIDINLPDCNGCDLMLRLKRQEGGLNCNTPMVAISAHVFDEEVAQYLAAGFNDYLAKPLQKEALAEEVQHWLCQPNEPKNQSASEVISLLDRESELLNVDLLNADLHILGQEKMVQIVTLFTQSSQEIAAQMAQASVAGDGEQIKNLAHKLKGSAGSLGLTSLMMLCQQIEADISPLQAYRTEQQTLDTMLIDSIRALKAQLGL
ncbi:TMAO reductase system sensor histidine kinase/response regulator TorS [Vibrio navarrensis]|uniref:TMAO reductase system sensor histidine kinase/response regulator TorS n=1 Tax=Vibrio navarrensis TaxID=29495 RepID=UPI001869A930|nr:TMAO reductase system sensor histidine kinase/response regulator TorS [Vibrio navarrensis]MBE4577156.1 TMAO reductase system sensor histidine kinase/response regulator TorS [Vibrio navarrensis]MBE4596067.1 TMAO reductase system sensor histidine kinase/response regulator TorS [Vibrio navarrensis]